MKTAWNGKNMGYEKNAQIRPSTGYPDPKESMQMGFQETEDQEKAWPAEEDCPGFRQDALRFMHEARNLSIKIMELFAEGLGLVRPALCSSLCANQLLIDTSARLRSRRTRSSRAPSRPKGPTRRTR